MAKVLYHVTMSLDGFIAGPGHTMDWMGASQEGRAVRSDVPRGNRATRPRGWPWRQHSARRSPAAMATTPARSQAANSTEAPFKGRSSS